MSGATVRQRLRAGQRRRAAATRAAFCYVPVLSAALAHVSAALLPALAGPSRDHLSVMESLARHFFEYFDVAPARTAADIETVWRLRFDVYCKELGYEDVAAFPDGMERDSFEDRARHCLVRHKVSGRTAGAFRLLLNRDDHDSPLPFEQVSRGVWHDTPLRPDLLPRSQFGELSRLAVHSDFRRRAGEQGVPVAVAERAADDPDHRSYPLIAMGLFLGASAMAINLDLARVYVMMEPRLARLLRSCGIRFVAIGDVIDYHGQRGPFVIDREALYKGLSPDALVLLEDLRARLA